MEKIIPEQVVAFVGLSKSGKSLLARRLGELTSLEGVSEYCSSATEEDFVASEQSEYFVIKLESKCLEIAVAPGQRKFWKWVDFCLSDSDSAILVVAPVSGSFPICSIIEPLVHMIAYGVVCAGIAVNISACPDCDLDSVISEIRSDYFRVFGTSDALCVLPFSFDDLNSIRSIGLFLGDLPRPKRTVNSTFAMSVTSVHSRKDCVLLGGKVLEGSVSVGDSVFLLPSAIPLVVSSVRVAECDVDKALCGSIVGIRFEGIPRSFVSTGMVLSARSVSCTRKIAVHVNFFNTNFQIKLGFSPMISILGCHVHGRIVHIERECALGDSTVVHVSLNKAVCVGTNNRLMRITMRQENILVGVGIITEILD